MTKNHTKLLTASTWNWETFFERAKAGKITAKEWGTALARARKWPTCACGQLCKKLPRDANGAPVDAALTVQGALFAGAVATRKIQWMIQTFHRIEARTAKLLREQGKGKVKA